MSPGLQASSQVLLRPGRDHYPAALPGAVQPCPQCAPGDPAGAHWVVLGNSSEGMPDRAACLTWERPARPRSAGETGLGAGRAQGAGDRSGADGGVFGAPSQGVRKPTASSRRRPSHEGPARPLGLASQTRPDHRHVPLPRLASASSRCAPHRRGGPPHPHLTSAFTCCSATCFSPPACC